MLTLLTLGLNVYFVRYQTYVLVAEEITGYAIIACQIIEILLGAIAAVEFKASES